jgi:hypothetical protein
MAARINPDFISTQIRELFQIFWRCNHFRFIGSTRPRVESLDAMGASPNDDVLLSGPKHDAGCGD